MNPTISDADREGIRKLWGERRPPTEAWCAVCGRAVGAHSSADVERCKADPRWPLTWRKQTLAARRWRRATAQGVAVLILTDVLEGRFGVRMTPYTENRYLLHHEAPGVHPFAIAFKAEELAEPLFREWA